MLEGLSEYERLRLENIQRNESFLKDLGIVKPETRQVVRSESIKKPRKKRSFGGEGEEVKEDEEADDGEALQPRRRSRRIQNLPADGEGKGEGAGADLYFLEEDEEARKERERRRERERELVDIISVDGEEGRKRVTGPSLQSFIAKVAPELSEEISSEMIVHTAYRMSYMSTAALATRLKQIAKAAKRSSHEKLLVFYFALRAARLLQLAQSAGTILQTLGVTLPPITREEGEAEG